MQIAKVDQLYVPNSSFTPDEQLRDAAALAPVKSAFATATYDTPVCVENGDPGKRLFICTGRIAASLKNWRDDDQNFKDTSETVDYFILDRAGGGLQQPGRHELFLRSRRSSGPTSRPGRRVTAARARSAADPHRIPALTDPPRNGGGSALGKL
ncbi:hypothetical protein [Streptomyces sp. PTD5-9]|uniref:hypothetical protein n=1 Tax=Streptomyces sp. PTD5-9 TaxID=3120150 RepID=UPI00300BD6B8